MFLDEARLAARIHHPNVVPIQEVGESDHGYYLVMDYIEGDTLARVLAKAAKNSATVPYGVTIRILLDVLAGLHAAHEMKDDHGEALHIVHRDVSPQNILVGVDGVARVVDFGVARAATRLSTTRSGQLKGKLAYMAPEQARGGAIDRRADLFACGIVLWEALATKRLFKGDGEAETLNRVLYDPIAPPSSVRPDVPKALEDICMKALARDVDQRFPTAQAFGDELEKVARGLGSVGSVRDVADCLQEVIGVDLTQQREAVRAWLARSEPSSSPGTGPRSRPMLDSIVTRVDGSSKPGSPASMAPEKVSSVSSAVLQVPHGLGGPASAPAPQSSSGNVGRIGARIAMALVAAVVLLAAGAWGAKSFGNRRAAGIGDAPSATAPSIPTAAGAAGGTTATTAGSGATAPNASAANAGSAGGSAAAATSATSDTSATPASSASGASSASSAAGAPGASGVASGNAHAAGTGGTSTGGTNGTGARPGGRPGGRPGARPGTSGGTKPGGGVPDELNNNPYR